MYLPSLSDAELVAHGNNTADSLTQSDLERELLKRLEARVEVDVLPIIELAEEFDIDAEALRDVLPIIELAEEFDIDAEALRDVLEAHPGNLADYEALLAKLNDCDIHTREQLDEQLERARSFYDLAQDAGDVFTRLADLAAKTE